MKTKDKLLADILFPSKDLDSLESILNIPPEQRRLNTESYDFTVSTIVDSMKKGQITVPIYQRGIVWSINQQSRLIESLIIQCPIPVIYLNQEKDEVLSVIDGNQRVNSLLKYLEKARSRIGVNAQPDAWFRV